MHQNKLQMICAGLIGLFLTYSQSIFAAQPINLKNQPASFFKSLQADKVTMKEISRLVDEQQTTHVRVQEMYLGVPVWGGDAIVHIPHGQPTKQTMTGIFYQGLYADLMTAPAYVFNKDQAEKAFRTVTDVYKSKIGHPFEAANKQSDMIIYIDKENKAHFAYHIRFEVEPLKDDEMPAHPNFIIDAASLNIYKQWDNIRTLEKEMFGGGFGGNGQLGKLSYDSLQKPGHFNKLTITRRPEVNLCALKNSRVIVRRFKQGVIITYRCTKLDKNHNNLYWNGQTDMSNGGYSPGNDALYGGAIISDLYTNWYGVPVLQRKGQSMKLDMIVHKPMANAYWDGNRMIFGDGDQSFYPFTSLDIAGHEVSHGFTEQHSGLVYDGQSGAIDESFSDMAGQTAQYYATGTNNWKIGVGIYKHSNRVLRYLDNPTKDGVSIDNANNYNDSLDVHHSSGVFNKAFYLLATTAGWNTRKAFDVMVRANEYYWTRTTNFQQGACGVISAAKDLNYSIADVAAAFNGVGIHTEEC